MGTIYNKKTTATSTTRRPRNADTTIMTRPSLSISYELQDNNQIRLSTFQDDFMNYIIIDTVAGSW